MNIYSKKRFFRIISFYKFNLKNPKKNLLKILY